MTIVKRDGYEGLELRKAAERNPARTGDILKTEGRHGKRLLTCRKEMVQPL